MKKNRIIIAITGASGAIYGIRILEELKEVGVETHLVISKSAQLTILQETDFKIPDIQKVADFTYPVNDIGAAISSGSFKSMGMIIAPCSIKTMSEIATGVTSNLISRAADVILKERKKLVLMVRETPLHLGHLRTMANLTEMGAIVAPPMPAFYPNPKNIDEIINHTVGRTLDLFDIESGLVKRWNGLNINN